MHNLSMDFSHPWLLLLLVPAVALTLYGYFRLDKKYRKTRKRITSIVLHLAVMLFAVTVLSGAELAYQTPNRENEIILLVDVSQTVEQSAQERDEFVQTVIRESQFDNFKIGIVTFGFDQQYAVPLTWQTKDVFENYKLATLPDISATNIAAALEYTKDLFSNPTRAKIVLITDGKETDEQALSVIKTVTANGMRVDTVNIQSQYPGDDIQIIGVDFPDKHLSVDEQFNIGITIQSKSATTAEIQLYDNGVLDTQNQGHLVALATGTQTIALNYSFKSQGLHQVVVKIVADEQSDTVKQNNEYHCYRYLDVYNNILMLGIDDQASDNLASLLTEGDAFRVTKVNIYNVSQVPSTIDALCEYDQVILNNIANRDMPEGFDALLYSYVHTHGGGLFTVGGNDSNGNANAYNREDMYGSLYQQMLPVQAINYTPPIGVMIVIDKSGSMNETDGTGRTRLEWAKAGAASSLDALSERDYVGIMTLDADYNMILPLTPRTQEARILSAIYNISEADGATVFPGAIDRAGQALRALNDVDKRHIIMVTDGGVPENQAEQYEQLIEEYNKTNGITLSVVTIGMNPGSPEADRMQRAVEIGKGRLYTLTNSSMLGFTMREELKMPDIKEVEEKPFYPTINNLLSPLIAGIERGENEDKNKMTVELNGYYGVKKREGADIVLIGEHDVVPIYAQWKFGNGMVGSFMSDLSGNWSADFMDDDNGKLFIKNAVGNLMPVQDIRTKKISIVLDENNYTNKLSVYTDLNDGEQLQGRIIDMASDNQAAISLNSIDSSPQDSKASYYVTSALSAANNYSRASFVIKEGGVYKIVIEKLDAAGAIVETLEVYKCFSYSEEYNTFSSITDESLSKMLASLAADGNGTLIADLSDPREVFEDFAIFNDKLFPLKEVLIILTIVLFLADIAVRKFRFKWPHEIIRGYKESKLLKKRAKS